MTEQAGLAGLLERAFGDPSQMRQPDGPLGFPLISGLADGDDGAVIGLEKDLALVTTADFFPPVVDQAFDWGRIAAANALSDVFAMGGQPIAAVNLLAWPVGTISLELAAEVLAGGRQVAEEAGCLVVGGHSVQDETPLYGMAVTGTVHPSQVLRIDAARPGDPISLTKPLGVGILNNRHKTTGEPFPQAVATMAALNRDAAYAAVALGLRAATDVTGFGLLGHLHRMAEASGVSAVIDHLAVPYLEGVRDSAAAGYVPGGTRRNLASVRPHLQSELPEPELVLLADAQTSGGLLVAGEVPGGTVIGEFTAPTGLSLHIR
jgi:selenide, water dikinase